MYRLTEYSENEIPPLDDAIQTTLDFISNIEVRWKFHKNFGEVKTYTTLDGEEYWGARVSYHNDISYDDMFKSVYLNHTEQESEYIGMIESYELLDSHQNWLSRRVHYKFSFPLKNRDMIIWLGQKETQKGKQFVNVTIPRKAPSQHTKAFYVSVEIVTLLDDGRIQWIVATSSDVGGWIPQNLQRPQLVKFIAEDVPQFKKWLKHRKRK